MSFVPIAIRRVALLLGLLLGLLPVLLYWYVVGRVPTVTPEQARELLAEPGTTAVLVDVRTPDEFIARHLEAAENWPLAELAAIASVDEVPKRFRGKQLLLFCESGMRSAVATR